MYFLIVVTLLILATNATLIESEYEWSEYEEYEGKDSTGNPHSSGAPEEKIDMSQFNCTINGICQRYCPLTHLYDENTRKCTSLVGEDCSPSNPCARNSYCATVDIYMTTTVYRRGWYSRPSTSAPSTVGTCKCNSGYIANNSSKICLATFGSACNSTVECHPYFKCAEGECRCHNPSYEAFDRSAGRCFTHVGGHCRHSSSSACGLNSFCDDFGKCECNPGYSRAFLLSCYLDKGQLCDNNKYVPYRIVPLRICNSYRGLSCVGGRCECSNSIHEYHKENRTCLLTTNQVLLEMRDREEQAQAYSSATGKLFYPIFQISFILMILLSESL